MPPRDQVSEKQPGGENLVATPTALSNAAMAEMQLQSIQGAASTIPNETNIAGINFGNTASLYGSEGANPFASRGYGNSNNPYLSAELGYEQQYGQQSTFAGMPNFAAYESTAGSSGSASGMPWNNPAESGSNGNAQPWGERHERGQGNEFGHDRWHKHGHGHHHNSISDGMSGPAQPGDPTGSPTDSTGTGTSGAVTPAPGSDTGSTTTGSAATASDAQNSQNLANSTFKITAYDSATQGDMGTGFMATLNGGANNGLIVTDQHVVQGASQITVTGSDGQTYQAKVVKSDAADDLAVLQIEGAQPTQYSAINVDSTGASATGTVTTAGHPLGDTQLVTNSGQYGGTTTFGALNVTDNQVAQNANRTLDIFNNLGTEGGSSGSAILNSQGQLAAVVDMGNGNGTTPSTETLGTPSSAVATLLSQAESAG